MKYSNIVKGTFLKRPNRFIAHVLINGKEEIVHVKNTGRCKELLIEGATVYLQLSNNPNRKTRYDLISVFKNDNLINMDSQVPNVVCADALANGDIKEIGVVDFIKREVNYGDSRYDIYYEKNGKKGFIEIKGVTLENNTLAMFPDAPTSRGQKHINGLIDAVKNGYEANVLFLIQMENVSHFTTNKATDPSFSDAVKDAFENGVKILVYNCNVTKETISLKDQINFTL